MVVLANDGITSGGQQALEKAGFEVQTVHVAQEQLA
ncbi:MAG: 3-phosphoglycerate dehydrogenase, partial [Robiginitalea sp.]